MRSGFGRRALEMRVERKLSQTQFCERSSLSLSRVSDIEHRRATITDQILEAYALGLNASPTEIQELRKLAEFSNSKRGRESKDPEASSLAAMLDQFGDKLSPSAKSKITKILESETGEKLSVLTFASSGLRGFRGKNKVVQTPQRLAEIALAASDIRQRVGLSSGPLDVVAFLELLVQADNTFDYDVYEKLPTELEGAFACIAGDESGSTIYLEQARLESAARNVRLFRQVMAHEVGHHVLHRHLLKGGRNVAMPPQGAARNSPRDISSESTVRTVIDTLEEAEAEAFGMFLLVPWETFYKGTVEKHIADDFRVEFEAVKLMRTFMRQDGVRNAFCQLLWQRGIKRHFLFEIE